MSASESKRSTTAIESNIPILKKSFAGAKKPKCCSKLPELQRYIETIIKASNEFDTENMSLSDKEKFPKGRHFGKHMICKGLENKIKHEKLKFEVMSNKRKNKRQTSKSHSEAVSRGVEVFNKLLSEFEDPRNWKIRNSESRTKIEKLIKKFYPNPYTIRCDTELKKSDTQIISENVKNNESGDETSNDVLISKVDAETQDDLDKTNIDLVTADSQVMISEREDQVTSANIALSSENLDQSLPNDKSDIKESKPSTITNSPKISTLSHKSSSIRPSISVSNASSRVSSIESISQVLCQESQNNLMKKPNPKANTKSSKEILPKVNSTVLSDYDLGKLKLLNLSDSDGSTSKIFNSEESETKNKNNIATDDFVNEISSEICNEISKTNDLNDLLQIYEVMNKATESFLYLTSIKKPTSENSKSIEVLKDSSDKELESDGQKDTEISVEKNSDGLENKNINETETVEGPPENKSDKELEEKSAVENTSVNISIKDKKSSEKEKNTEANTKSEPEKDELENAEQDTVRSSHSSDSKENEQKVEHEIFDANQKINEVLEFMSDCFLKFTKDEKVKREEKTKEEDIKKINLLETTVNDSTETKKQVTLATFQQSSAGVRDENLTSYSQTGSQTCEEAQSTHASVLEKSNKSPNIRIRFKRKSKTVVPNSQEVERNTSLQISVRENEASTSDFNIQPVLNAESALVNDNENVVFVAEGQNELGAYTEAPQELNIPSNDDSRVSKSVLPLSAKIRRSQPETYKTLKDALETEEKLLKINKPEPKKLVTCNPETQILIQNDTISGYSPISNFENPSLVLCISPTVITPNLPIPKPLSLSLIDCRSWNLKPLSPLTKEHTLEKLSLPSYIEQKTLKLMYCFRVEIISIVSNARVHYSARPVCFVVLTSLPKIEREYSLEFSKCQIRVKPLKKFSIVNLSTPGTSGFCIKNTVTFTASKSNLLDDSDTGTDVKATDKSMEDLIRAIQETENVFLLQQHTNSGCIPLNSFESLCSCRSNKDSSDNEEEKENDKQKVQDLLLRTYKLQKKLQQYLCNISQVQPTILSQSLIKQDAAARERSPSSDETMTNDNVRPRKLSPPIQKSLQLSTGERSAKSDEAVSVNVQMVDRSTTYFPPKNEEEEHAQEDSNKQNYKKKDPLSIEEGADVPLNSENDQDDRSSTYSFKSSNDFSETNDNLVQESSSPVINGDAIKRIFSRIELLKQNVDGENLKRQEKKLFDKTKEKEGFKDNKLVEFDPKNPAKVLKTVFKGRKSSTELTIGLKDVPMTKVSNISVEKTKFSPNHTKISICISKETPNQMSSSDNSDSKLLPNKVSSYFFDHMRPSLSMCQTEFSKLEDNGSKTSQSFNEASDDDEDFKSVGSTFDSNSSTSPKSEKSKAKNQEVVEVPPAKNYTKHKFDFYRKMDMNVEGLKVRQKPLSNSLWRFKELEPLKQALTELQIRMRSIRREAILNSNDYYERALKLAKMSAGYCQSCGTRAVIPDDTFGYYKNLLPRRHAQNRRNRHFKTTITPNSSFYSFRSSNAEVSGQFCDLDIKGSSSFSLNQTTHSNRTVLRSSLQDMPIVFEKM